MTLLSYSISDPFHRSPVEEWQPHQKQSASTTEWWYVTTVVYDSAGNPYFLVWCPFHLSGEKTVPQAVELRSDQRFVTALSGLTDYQNQHHIGDHPIGVMNETETWKPETRALHFAAESYTSLWSYDGETMHLTVTSPHLSYDLHLTDLKQVMYAKDKLGIEGFIQEGAEQDRSYYYSLPRVAIAGRITYLGKNGIQREIDVTGQGWVDRQWGDFLTNGWEWSSLRFSNGARVNLYHFANGYEVATYQKADGSTQWLDSFLLRQNGYLKTPRKGVWLSWGWSYEFPIEIEGSRHYTLEPFSRLDVYELPLSANFEGPSRLINDEAGATVGNAMFEGPSRLINDETGATVGIAVSESMDIRMLHNGPYDVNQR